MIKKLLRPGNMDFGLLLFRFGIGIMFLFVHGLPKVTGGPGKWEKIGSAMAGLGLDFAPLFWGGLAAFTEFFGGLLLIVGLLTRPISFFLLITMIVAVTKHLDNGDGWGLASHAFETGCAFLLLLFSGAGKYSLDYRLFSATGK